VASLRLTDIQGNILRGYGFSSVAYLFFEVPEAESGRAFLREIVDEVTSAEHWDEPPATTTNVALTYMGLRALGVAGTVLRELPAAFVEPIRHRAPRVLGDIGPSAPEMWVEGLGTERSHILVTIAASSKVDRSPFEAAVSSLLSYAELHGLGLLHRQDAVALPNRREHFGWADGYGQPAVEGVGNSMAGEGVPRDDGITWRDVKAGEFILGHPDEDGQIVADPLLRNGTFMVYRKLYQDVARFRCELYAEAARYAQTVELEQELDGDQLYELMAAKVVGRWRDGVAIELLQRRVEANSSDLGGGGAGSTRQRLSLRARRRRRPVPQGCAHPPHEPPRCARRGRRDDEEPPHHPARDAVRRAPAEGRIRRRPQGPWADLHLPQCRSRAAVRADPVIVVQRRQRLWPRQRQGLPARRQPGYRQGDHPG